MAFQSKLFVSGSAVALPDLAPRRSQVWRQTSGSIVFLWPRVLKADPKDNADVLLAYDKGGLYNKLGRMWVCWGDLRTERMRDGRFFPGCQGDRSPARPRAPLNSVDCL